MAKILYIQDKMKNKAGMERILTAKINYLAEHTDHQLFLLTYEQNGCPFPFELNQAIHQISIDNSIPLRKDYSLLIWFSKYLSARKHFCHSLKEILKNVKPEIVVCNVYSFALLDIIIRISSSYSIKTIIESHTKVSSTFVSHKLKYNKVLYYLFQKWDKYILYQLKSTSYVVALTEQDANDWQPYVNKVVIIPNFITIVPKTVKNYSAKRVISAGRYAYEKGYDSLLQAWTKVTEDYPEWELHIYGDGERDTYKHLSEQYRITGSVFLHPSTPDIAEEFSNSSIFVMSSRYEGFGLVLVEAMSCGLPCIAFDCPYGPRNIIMNKHNGILVDNQDIDQLSKAIEYLIHNVTIRESYGRNAMNIINKYNRENIMNQWITLFNNLNN